MPLMTIPPIGGGAVIIPQARIACCQTAEDPAFTRWFSRQRNASNIDHSTVAQRFVKLPLPGIRPGDSELTANFTPGRQTAT